MTTRSPGAALDADSAMVIGYGLCYKINSRRYEEIRGHSEEKRGRRCICDAVKGGCR